MRIYPPHLEEITFEPQAEDFLVVDVDGTRGQGVVVLNGAKAGDLLFRMNGVWKHELTLHTLQIGPDLHLDDPYVAGKVLHSCKPNSRLEVSNQVFYAVRDIQPGELLTMDYDLTEDVLFRSFDCCCGAENCRGEIAGRMAHMLVSESA